MQSYPFLSAKRPFNRTTTPSSGTIGPFDQDVAQIIHTGGFRLLQGKSSIWVSQANYLFGTRLTHSIETAQIGETLSQIFEFPPQILSAAGLAHELGHPPFGTEGAAVMSDFAQSISQRRRNFSATAQTWRCLAQLCQVRGGQDLNPTAALFDALLIDKQPVTGDRNFGGYYPEEQELFHWTISQAQTHMRKNPLAMLLEVADTIADVCRNFEDAVDARYLVKEGLLQEIHALLLAEPQLSPWCEACFLAPIAAMSPYEELKEIKNSLKLRLMQSFFEQVIAVRSSPAFYVRLMTLDYPQEKAGQDTHNLLYQYCPLLRKALEFLRDVVGTQISKDIPIQTLIHARSNLLRNYLEEYRPLLLERAKGQHPLLNTLPAPMRIALQGAFEIDQRLQILLDYVSGLTDRDLITLANRLKGHILQDTAIAATR